MLTRLALIALSREYKTESGQAWKRDLVGFFKALNGSEKPHDFLTAFRGNPYVLHCDEIFPKRKIDPLFYLQSAYKDLSNYAKSITEAPDDFYFCTGKASHAGSFAGNMADIIERHQRDSNVLPDAYRLKNANISKAAKFLYREFFRVADKVLVEMQSELPAMRELEKTVKEFYANTRKLQDMEKRLDQRETALSETEARLNLALKKAEAIERENEANRQIIQDRADQIETISENLKGYFNTIKTQNDQLLSGSPNTPKQSDTLNDMLALVERLKKS